MNKRLFGIIALAAGLCLCTEAFAESHGRIIRIDFAGATFVSHPDVVQIQIEGGFSQGTCNTTFAAARKRDSQLVSFLLASHMAGAPITVYLDETDRYFDNRCTINFAHSDLKT